VRPVLPVAIIAIGPWIRWRLSVRRLLVVTTCIAALFLLLHAAQFINRWDRRCRWSGADRVDERLTPAQVGMVLMIRGSLPMM
jgi:hypothetical protein